MERNEIINFIRDSGIGIDSNTLSQTVQFICSNVGNLTPDLEYYEILSATAIVGETVVLEDISYTKRAKSGITLEHVMRHIGKLSKEQYLDVLTRQVQKWREAPLWLKSKTQNLKLSYRIYKKYRTVFDELCQVGTTLDDRSRFNLMATFWIIYLYVKNQNVEFDNVLVTTSLIHAIFLFAFSEVMARLPHIKSSISFRKQFPESQMPTGEQYTHLSELIFNKLNEINHFRYQGKSIDLHQLATNYNYSQRYLDDLSNLYDKFKEQLPENTINQISYLELTKNLTPQAVRQSSNDACIETRIDFTKSDDDDDYMNMFDPTERENSFPDEEENFKLKNFGEQHHDKLTPKREAVSPIKSFPNFKGAATPISVRHMNLNWINGITAQFIEEEAFEVHKIYQKYAKRNYKYYQNLALKNITDAIYEFTPECTDFGKRQRSIYHFYEYLINRIAETHVEAEMVAIFNEDTNFSSILCLTTDLFNYAYLSLSGCYRSYCKIFGISLLEGYKPINWFGLHSKMPKDIQSYLYQLEKKILIEQIWQDNEGYLLLSNQIESKKYHNQALLKRLYKHVNERTQELCYKMSIEQRQITRIVNLVKYILQKRPILLRNHRIDQIIVCSIASILSINRSHSQYSLEQIFDYYNQLILSFYSNKNFLYDSDGNQIDLINFYNNIFLHSVEDIINNEEQAQILATPIRLERNKSKELGIQMTPIPRKFKQTPTFNIPARKMGIKELSLLGDIIEYEKCEVSNSYRLTLANSLRNLEDLTNQKQEYEDNCPSPTFGGGNSNLKIPQINKTFSFQEWHDKP